MKAKIITAAKKLLTTSIDWVLNSDRTAGYAINLWIGCSKISPACDNCYAEISRVSTCLGVKWGDDKPRHKCNPYKKLTSINNKASKQGIRIRVFINPDSDIFDNKVPQEWRDEFFNFVWSTPSIDYILVTKRIGNAKNMIPQSWLYNGYPANVWQLITVCNQAEADRDISKLLELDVSVRGVSAEPLLSDVDFSKWLCGGYYACDDCDYVGELGNTDKCYKCCAEYDVTKTESCPECGCSDYDHICPKCGSNEIYETEKLNWIIVGFESGKNARPGNPQWSRKIRDQCVDAGVPFFFKQNGEWANPASASMLLAETRKTEHHIFELGSAPVYKIGKKRAGNLLDGKAWQQMPEVSNAKTCKTF